MLRLISYELGKLWRRPGFLLAVCALLSVHMFLLWYTSLPDGEGPDPGSYRALQRELSRKSEEEKQSYLAELKETLDGVLFVQDVLSLQGFGNEMGDVLAGRMLQENPGVFEQYYKRYVSGDYLRFTSSPEQEIRLIDEVYQEMRTVAGYGEYLRSIQESREILEQISLFSREKQDADGGLAASGRQDGYSARNLKKSAEDYRNLSDKNVRFMPSKSIVSAVGCVWTDLLLFFSVLLAVSILVTEEKEKKLLLITRCTRYGRIHSAGAMLSALWIHCATATVLFYGVSLVFYGQSMGWADPGAALQSLSPYRESSLSVSILGYLFLSVLTKAFVMFGMGALLSALCLWSRISAMPFLGGSMAAGGSVLLYVLIPAGSAGSVLKYMNPAGFLRTENLYGRYLNFNLFGYPVSRLWLSLWAILLFAAAGILLTLSVFCRMQNFEVKKLRLPSVSLFRPHVSLFQHEGYKLLITNRGLLIFLVFLALLAWKSLGKTYDLSPEEAYYRDIMERLAGETKGGARGELDEEKETLILTERARYEEAFRKLELLEEAEGAGELDWAGAAAAADAEKSRLYAILSFYPSFQRVEKQYQNVREQGGRFIYDTGYLHLFGVWEEAFPTDFLILTAGIVLAVSGVLPLEYRTGSLGLIGASRVGKRKIIRQKVFLCALLAAALALVPTVCRSFRIASAYPPGSFCAALRNIPHYAKFPVLGALPVWAFLLLFGLTQAAAGVFTALAVLALSLWRKNQTQTIFFALLILAVPMILMLLGFTNAEWFSLYPVYAWTGIR